MDELDVVQEIMADEESIARILRAQLGEISDSSIRGQIDRLLIPPRRERRAWDYGSEGEAFSCWFVLVHEESNTGIVYCDQGFGPGCPWGLMFLTGTHLSIGPDASWYPSFVDAFVDSMAYSEDAEQAVDGNPH